ncbi:MAG: vitamin K epoxide reductase family protein [Thermomicrobiales bacterium]|nr:vitamin K epoxide reductase family protein [Thermomicrobiales bacterium]MCO5220648.1 vitamin K epoxide reductase family protein [Thermomicrobiales bacterium]
MQRLQTTSRLTAISLGLALAGIAVSAYLTLVHYRDDLLVCAVSGCHTVQKSPYAELAGIPVAALGLGMFALIVLLGALRRARPDLSDNLTLAIFAIVLAGSVFAIYLTWLELFVIDAICQWCVLTALLIWASTIVEGTLAWRALKPPDLDDYEDEVAT